MNGLRTAALLMACLVTTTGCLGLFGDDEETEDANATSLQEQVGEQAAQEIEQRTTNQFRNYTVAGQDARADSLLWLNGTVSGQEAAASQEDRNDRSGTNYNTEIIAQDISEQLPPGQPAVIKAKLYYFAGPGRSADLDVYMNVPGTQTEWAGDDCDEFSWKVCVQEVTTSTVGVDGEPAEVGVQVSNGRALVEDLEYFLRVEIAYEKDVITPYVPYAVQVPANATGLVITSQKAGGGEHIQAELLLVGPDDELVSHLTYNDIAIPTESKLIPVEQPGEYVIYIHEIKGGFLGLEADVPVPQDQREVRPLERVSESVQDGSAPAPGKSQACPADLTCGPSSAGGSATFSAEGTFPLEITGWIGQDGTQQAYLNAEIRISSSNGEVFRANEWVKYEDERGTIGMTRSELNTNATFENLAKGEYTVDYVIDGTGNVGHTLVTYKR